MTALKDERMLDLLDRKDLGELAQADQLMSALADAFPPATDRRQTPRLRYQVRARLELVDENGLPVETQTLHTRDIDPNSAGFVTATELPGSNRAVLHLPDPSREGKLQAVACRVRRTREAGNGWFEGVVEFEAKQPTFSSRPIQ